jgi:hypothetical protein
MLEVEVYWALFAANGNPNGLGPVYWLRSSSDRELLLQLDFNMPIAF